MIGELVPAPADRRAFADREGYLYLPGLLAAEALAPLRAHVAGALAARGWVVDGESEPALGLGRWDDARWHGFLGDVLPSAPYRALAAAPAIVAVLREVFGAEPVLHVGDVCRLVSPGDPALTTPPHQDAAYLADATRVWTAWLALHPCPRTLGPIAVWPGSHANGLQPHAPVVAGGGVVGTEVPPDVTWAASDLALGDVVMFSALTIHRALDNTTARTLRISVDYRYRPAP